MSFERALDEYKGRGVTVSLWRLVVLFFSEERQECPCDDCNG